MSVGAGFSCRYQGWTCNSRQRTPIAWEDSDSWLGVSRPLLPLLTGMSAVAAAGMADGMYHRGLLLQDLKFDVFGFVAVAILIVYAPLLSFLPALSRCKFQGLLNFGKLVWDHDRAFEKKWLAEGADGQGLVGSPDISSLADAGIVYEHVGEMWSFPFNLKAFAVLIIAAMLPFAILLPIKECILSFGELLI